MSMALESMARIRESSVTRSRRVFFALPKIAAFALNALWAVPAVLLMRAVRPWVHVRVGVLRQDRIGHFVADAAFYLAERKLRSQRIRTVDLLWFPQPTANAHWARMVRRKLIVAWWVRYLITFNRRLPGGAAHAVTHTNASRDVTGLLPRTDARFEFLSTENDTAKSWLRRRGWRDGEPFVCLLVRDSAFLSTHPMHARYDSSYHDYRDSDIGDYVEAMQALVDRGYWVVRLGQIMHKRFPLAHPRVIDYPFVDDQDDLLDIWLAAHCAMFVSTGTGIDTVPLVYQRPLVFVNFTPFPNILSYGHNICVPKRLVWKRDGRALTLKEQYRHGYIFYGHEYDAAGIAIRNLTPAEITAAVLEGEARLTGRWVESGEDRQRQSRFWRTLRTWPEFQNYHGYLHPEARVGSAWLKAMGDEFLE